MDDQGTDRLNKLKFFGVAATLGLALPCWAASGNAGVVPPGAISDLAITLTASPNPVRVGSLLTYTAVLTNLGPSPAAEVYIAMPLPAGTTLVSAELDTLSGARACNLAAGVVQCFSFFGVGATTAATPRTATIVVSVSSVDTAAITASASAELAILFIPPIPQPDPDLSNNTATITTTVGTTTANVPSLGRSGLVLIALLFGLIGLAGVQRPT